MRRAPQVPAPDRDLANVTPHLPHDSFQAQPIERTIFGTVAVAIGAIILFSKLSGAIADTIPGPDRNPPAIFGDWLAVSGAICFFVCGFLMFLKSRLLGTIIPAVLVAIGLILSILSRWFAA